MALSVTSMVGRERHDLGVEAALGLRLGGALLRLQRVLVLRLAADAVLLGHDLGGLDHRHVELRHVLAQPRDRPARKRLILSFCTSEIDSRPPPTATVMPSTMICLAAVAIAIRPEEHWRSMVMPDTVTGRPARSADWRAMLEPVVPCCRAAAHDHVVDLAGIDAGALDRLAR